MNRRDAMTVLMKSFAAMGVLLSLPSQLLAKWAAPAFEQKAADAAIQALFGDMPLQNSDKITLEVPTVAENGAIVPMSIASELPAQQVAIVIDKNPLPLAFNALIPKGTTANLSTRCRMSETSVVRAIIKADGALYTTQAEVKVTIGGCGG